MSATIEGNWLVGAKERFSCGGLDVVELKSLEIAYGYEYFFEVDPDLIPQESDAPLITTSWTLVGFYNRIACGNLLSELEYHWALTELARLRIEYIE